MIAWLDRIEVIICLSIFVVVVLIFGVWQIRKDRPLDVSDPKYKTFKGWHKRK